MTYISTQPLNATTEVDHDHAWHRESQATDDGTPSVYSCELCGLTWTMYFESPRVGPPRPSPENL